MLFLINTFSQDTLQFSDEKKVPGSCFSGLLDFRKNEQIKQNTALRSVKFRGLDL